MSVQESEIPEYEEPTPAQAYDVLNKRNKRDKGEFYRTVNWASIEGSEDLNDLEKAQIERRVQPNREETRKLRREKVDAPGNLEAALSQGINRAGLYTGQVGEFIGESTGIESLTNISKEQIAEETEQIEEMQDYRTSREDIGLGSFDEIGAGISYYSEALLETAPIIVAGVGATLGAAYVAPALGITGLGAAVLAGGAGVASQVPYFFGSNITRGKETEELDYGKAFLASLGQSTLSQITNLIGLKLLSSIGKPAADNFMRNIGKGGEGLFTKPASRLKSAGKGAAFTGGVEGLTEAGQAVLERWQAGLDVTSPEAVKEYTTALIDGAVLGSVMGGTAGLAGVDAGSMQRKGEEEALRKKKIEDLDTKIKEEVKSLGDDIPDWRAEQVSREVRSEAYFKDAKDYYDKEVAAGADPEQAKADIRRELNRVLLVEQDRETAPTTLQPRTESSSMAEVSTAQVNEFVDSLGTEEVNTNRPSIEPKVQPVEVEPEVEGTVTDIPVEQGAGGAGTEVEGTVTDVPVEQSLQDKSAKRIKLEATAKETLERIALADKAPIEQEKRLDANELTQDPDQDPAPFDDDPAAQITAKESAEIDAVRTRILPEREVITKVLGTEKVNEETGEVRFDTPVPVTDLLNAIQEKEPNPVQKELTNTLITRYEQLKEAGVEITNVVAGGKPYRDELRTSPQDESGVIAGLAIPSKNLIYLNTDEQVPEGLSSEVTLHEATHGILVPTVLIGRQNLDTELGKTVTELDDIQGVIQEHLNKVLKPLDPYVVIENGEKIYRDVPTELLDTLAPVERKIVEGANTFKNADETLAWTRSNDGVRKYLEGIKVPEYSPLRKGNKIKNLWEAFVDWAARLIKADPTALSKVLDVSERLLKVNAQQVARKMPGARKEAQGLEQEIKLRNVLSLFKRKKSKPKAETKVEPKVEPKAKTKPKPKPKTKTKKLVGVGDKPARTSFDKASQEAMAEKIYGVQVKNIEADMEASNKVTNSFRLDESETPTFLGKKDLNAITKLMNNIEKTLLGGENNLTKTPESAAWNYFKGFQKPESALGVLAWELGVGIDNAPAFSRPTKTIVEEKGGPKALTELPSDRLSAWEEAFFTGTGGNNTELFSTWVSNNLSKSTKINIQNAVEVFKRRNDNLTSLPTATTKVVQKDDPFSFAAQSPVKYIDPDSIEGQEILNNTDWDKRDRAIAAANIERDIKEGRAKNQKAVWKNSRNIQRNKELDVLASREMKEVNISLAAGRITKVEAEAKLKSIQTETAKLKNNVGKLKDSKLTKAQQQAELDTLEIEAKGLAALGDLAEIEGSTFLDIMNIAAGNADSKPLTLKAAKELDTLSNPALVDVIKNSNKRGNNALLVALDYLYKTTSNKDIRQVIQTFYGKLKGDDKINFKLTKKDLPDVKGVPVVSEYDPSTNTITINEKYLNARALLHEIAHALVHKAVKQGKLPAIKDLTSLYTQTKDALGDVYGTYNLEEFIAEAFSNVVFRRRLASISALGEELNVLQKFTNAVRRLLNSALKRTGFGSRLSQTDALSQVDQLLNEIVPPVGDLDSYLSGATSASVVEKILDTVNKSRGNKAKIIDSTAHKNWVMRFYLSASKEVQLRASYLMQNQSFADMAESVGLKNMLQIDKFLGDLKGATDRVKKEVGQIITFYDKFAKKAGVDGVKAFKDVIYSVDFGSTIHQVPPQLTRAEAKKLGATKFAVWEAQRPAWNKLRTIVVDGKNGHDLYNDMNGYYVRQYIKMRELLTGRVNDLVRSRMEGKTETQIKAEIERTKNEIIAPIFDKQPLEVYFPLTRAGQYGVSFKLYPDSAVAEENPRHSYTFEMYQTYEEAEARIEDLKKAVRDAEKNKGTQSTGEKWFDAIDLTTLSKSPIDTYSKTNQANLYGPDPAIVSTIFRKVTDIGESSNLTSTEQEQLNTSLAELYIDLLPETSFAKQFQVREGVQGYVGDPLFALQTKGMAMGLQIARRTIAPDIEKFQKKISNLAGPDMTGLTRSGKFLPNKNENRRAWESMREVAQRKLEDLRTPPEVGMADRFASNANAYAFMLTIGFNVSSAIVNLSQLPLVVQNKLAGTYGFKKSLLAMGKALKYIHVSDSGISIGMDNYFEYSPKTDTYEIKTTAPKAFIKDLERLKPLVTFIRKRGLLTEGAIDQQFIRSEKNDVPVRQAGNFETERMFRGYGKNKDGTVREGVLDQMGNLQDKIVALSGIAFSGAEKISRQATMIATYLLEMDRLEAAGSRKRTGTEAQEKGKAASNQEKAIEEAIYIMQETNGASFRESAPPLTRMGLLAITMMYKTFGLQMYYLQLKQLNTVINTTFRSRKAARTKNGKVIPGATEAEVDEMRRQRKAAVAFVMGNTAVGLFLSGVVGNPLYGAVQMMYDTMLVDEEEEDYRNFNMFVRDALGNNALVRGYIAEALGINAGDRMRLSSLIMPEDKFKRDMDIYEQAFRAFAGPAGSVAAKLGRAGEKAVTAYTGNGDYTRAVEEALPSGLGNIIKALGRYESEGVRDKSNMIIRDDLTSGELAAQLFGFTPMKIVRIQEDIGERKYIQRRIEQRRGDLIKAYMTAYFHEDMDTMLLFRRKMVAFNNTHSKFPGYRITEGNISRSKRSREAIRKTGMADGVKIPKAMRPILDRQDDRYYYEKLDRNVSTMVPVN